MMLLCLPCKLYKDHYDDVSASLVRFIKIKTIFMLFPQTGTHLQVLSEMLPPQMLAEWELKFSVSPSRISTMTSNTWIHLVKLRLQLSEEMQISVLQKPREMLEFE